jgi:hypothetical protein
MLHPFVARGGDHIRCRLVAAAVLVSIACGDDDPSTPSYSGSAGSGGRAGSGGEAGSSYAGGGSSGRGGSSGDGGSAGSDGAPARALPAEYQPGPVEGRPLLDAYVEQHPPCAVTREPALLGTDVGVLLRGGDSTWFAHADNSRGTGSTEAGVGVTRLVNGALGPEVFTLPEQTRIPQLQAVFDGERITLVWRRDRPEPTSPFASVSELALAQLDPSGTLITPARAIIGSPIEEYDGRLVPTAQGFVLFWIQRPQNTTPYQARVAHLGPDGALVGEPRVLIEQDTYLLTTSLTWLGDRVVATYAGEEGYTSVMLDEQARPLGDAIPIGQAHWSAVLPRGERVLSAWMVTHELPATEESTLGGEYEYPSRAITLRVGWFDRDGKATGASRDLQAPVPDEENVDPAWVDLGEDVGLLWSQGSVIYVCGGCMPDNHLQLVVLDGETLQPKTGVLRLDNPASQGGLIRPQIVAAGSDQIIVGEVGYHTDAEAMTATVRCVQ